MKDTHMKKEIWITTLIALFTFFSGVSATYAVLKADDAVARTKTEQLEKFTYDLNETMKDFTGALNNFAVVLGRFDERLKNLEED